MVGGVGAVALIGGGLFLYYWRKKRAQSDAAGGAAGLGGSAQEGSPYYSPQPGSVMPDRNSYYPNPEANDAAAPVYGGAVKAELPANSHDGNGTDPNKPDQTVVTDTPAQRETWEMEGLVRQDTPLMELEAHETQNR